MTTDLTVADVPAEELRTRLVDDLIASGAVRTEAVEAALRRVPRHLFAPEVSLEAAYANDTVRTKSDERGTTISSVSAPWLQATMLEHADLSAGMHCLEVGSGGYNAALMAELVGPTGAVTTVDIDPDVTDRASRSLSAAGYDGQVAVVLADAEYGVPEHARYDRIVVTVGAWDVPPAWIDQLVDGGLLVVPLRLRGLTRGIAFQRHGQRLESIDYFRCGFVLMQGAGAYRGRSITLHPAGVNIWGDDLESADADALAGALARSRAEVWTGVTISPGESWADQDLSLLTLPGFCQLAADQKVVDQGVVAPSWRMGTPTLVDGDSFAYRARVRPVDETRTVHEFGAYGHGPRGGELAERLAEQIRVWDREQRHGPRPRLTVVPVDAQAADIPDGFVLTKRHSKIVISWAGTAS
ncbi:methyltransferase, FxLD system [Frankia sp. ACN10a]|uniref:methyltransferase, FxLD system n=1 Tax=Frankia sp. ACN10a TaxID=2926031 RepID=UPI002118B8F2|nr:methyltransferase, FxLD system [Frankia sp. ACN10a]